MKVSLYGLRVCFSDIWSNKLPFFIFKTMKSCVDIHRYGLGRSFVNINPLTAWYSP